MERRREKSGDGRGYMRRLSVTRADHQHAILLKEETRDSMQTRLGAAEDMKVRCMCSSAPAMRHLALHHSPRALGLRLWAVNVRSLSVTGIGLPRRLAVSRSLGQQELLTTTATTTTADAATTTVADLHLLCTSQSHSNRQLTRHAL